MGNKLWMPAPKRSPLRDYKITQWHHQGWMGIEVDPTARKPNAAGSLAALKDIAGTLLLSFLMLCAAFVSVGAAIGAVTGGAHYAHLLWIAVCHAYALAAGGPA